MKKIVFAMPASIIFLVVMSFEAKECFAEGIVSAVRYFAVTVVTYIFMIIPVNFFIKFRQAEKQGIDFIEFIFEVQQEINKNEDTDKKVEIELIQQEIAQNEVIDKKLEVAPVQQENTRQLVTRSNGKRTSKSNWRRNMTDEELRCFALQCNDYVEKNEMEEGFVDR